MIWIEESTPVRQTSSGIQRNLGALLETISDAFILVNDQGDRCRRYRLRNFGGGCLRYSVGRLMGFDLIPVRSIGAFVSAAREPVRGASGCAPPAESRALIFARYIRGRSYAPADLGSERRAPRTRARTSRPA